jgi:hypothetical protein
MKSIILLVLFVCFSFAGNAQNHKSNIEFDKASNSIFLSDSLAIISIHLKCDKGCEIDQLTIKNNPVVSGGNRIYTGFTLGTGSFTSANSSVIPAVSIANNVVSIRNIRYGSATFGIEETWIFTILKNNIRWQIIRSYLNEGSMEKSSLPVWTFNSMQTWDGAILNNGGVAWCRFLEKENYTYGAHTSGMTFWNRSNNTCFRISSETADNLFPAASFSHLKENAFGVEQTWSDSEINTKYGFRRFIEKSTDIFAPISVKKSTITVTYSLQALTYDEAYDRGTLKGINETSVNEILNTIARYSVVDQNLYGSNGWRTGYAVLQEQWLALFGLAINDPEYINGFSQTLEYEKEHAIMPNGRVLPRWHHDASDAMPNTFTNEGYYECQWGYMLDSQPAYAIDVAEQFDMTGNMIWLKSFKQSCESALEFMIRRDSDENGLYEVIQNSHLEEKGTDWLDVVWASYEVASINALMYKALIRWSELEILLDDQKMAERYLSLALKLKTAYNKNIADGGFWNPEKQWYVHWREKDGSVYGNNLVTVVNFLAIAYGVCDNPIRKEVVLSKMEELTRKENLFIWPACYFPYEENVGLKNVNYPWPNYENGDLFLGWAELGIRCYAQTNPEIAVKYIKNVIAKYEQDGLAHQRYQRKSQMGSGEDILANNAMAIVGLYRNIYGIRPQYNRLYLDPHITAELNGTELKYILRDKNYLIGLKTGKTTVKTDNFTVSSSKPFGVNPGQDEIAVFYGNDDTETFKVRSSDLCSIELVVNNASETRWKQTSGSEKTRVEYVMNGLKPAKRYTILVNNSPVKVAQPDKKGNLNFGCFGYKNMITIKVE